MALFKKRKTAADQEEMSFIDHLEALRGHLFRSVLSIAVGAVLAAVYDEYVVKHILLGPTRPDFPTYGVLCRLSHSLNLGQSLCFNELGVKMQSTMVGSQFGMYITVILVSGIVLAFPYIFYEFWKFIKPALTKRELDRSRGVVFWVSLLFFTGVLFGYFVIAPYTINFFSSFQLDESIENRWTISSYVDTLIPIVLGTGLAFQLPLVIFFLAKVGIVTASYLKSVRRYAIVVVLIIAAVITPGPDLISQISVALPLMLLYEISIILSKKVEKQRAAEEKEWS
ncbi:MAG: twin-arginine translocase subunit TatC [Chitinophagaceae bacterium]